MVAKTKKHEPKATKAKIEGPIQIKWSLGELPSSQHKTGLVGLVLLVWWLSRKSAAMRRGVLQVLHIDRGSAEIKLDVEGLSWLFDEIYAATEIESERDAPFKNVEPRRIVERQVQDKKKVDKKTGQPVVKTVKKYVYPLVQPRGAFLAEIDPGGEAGPWIKLWRDFIWGVLRAVPATRTPYNARAAGTPVDDASDAWDALTRGAEKSIELPSTYFVGAQAATAENVAFRDIERFQFLLHFWPFAVGLAVPSVFDREGKNQFAGHVVSFPDVADLENFCDEYQHVLQNRGADLAGYLPRQAVLDLPAEGGLQFLSALRSRLNASEGKKVTRDLVLGVDVFYLVREGNNVRTRSTTRIEPIDQLQDEYERCRSTFRDGLFRREVLLNLLNRKPWHHGFDRLFATTPASHFLRGYATDGAYPSQFPSDVQKQFKHHSVEVLDD
jgi:CRISPR-associated protein Cmx8